MTNLLNKSVLVYDTSGDYEYIAAKLAESFGSVKYYVEWVGTGHPKSIDRLHGSGLAEVERVYTWLQHAEKADVVVCPFVYCWDEIEHLRKLGKPVWGAGKAEVLENERWETKRLMKTLGMPIVPGEPIVGLAALRTYLKDKTDLFIKTSVTRGDFETRKFTNYRLIVPWLDKLAVKLGPRQYKIEFVVEEPIEGIETGFDGVNIDGDYGAVGAYGYEIKNCGYVLKVCNFDDLPDPIRTTNLAFAVALKNLGCRGFFSNEIRVSEDGTAYLIDPTMRAGLPPSASMMEVFDNWSEVIWAGARGEVVDLHPVANFAAEIVLKSPWVIEDTLPVYYPPEIAQWVKLCGTCTINNQRYVLPTKEDADFGFVVGLGDTLKEAVAHAVDNAEQIEALDLDWRHDVFDEAMECIKKGRQVGVEW